MAKKKTKYEKPAVVPLGETAGGAACAEGALAANCPSGGGVSGAPCDCGSSTETCFVGDTASGVCANGNTR